MSTPNPSLMAKFIRPVAAPVAKILVDTEPESLAKIVRPGTRTITTSTEHDGVVKAKALVEGQVVQAWLHGQPRGGERTVASVTRIGDGAEVLVSFSSPHPDKVCKAAYRFYDATLAGTQVVVAKNVPALVAYEEV